MNINDIRNQLNSWGNTSSIDEEDSRYNKVRDWINYETIRIYSPDEEERKNKLDITDTIFTSDFSDQESINSDNAKDIDCLAFYRSFHWDPFEKWGIYILDDGIGFIASELINQNNSIHKFDAIYYAFKILYYHEFFHYITDIAATILEVGDSFHDKYYINYLKYVYNKNPTEQIEESLANAYTYKSNKILGNALKNILNKQPGSYSKYNEYINKDKFNKGLRVLGTYISEGWKNINNNLYPLEVLFDIKMNHISTLDVPLYICTKKKIQDFVLRFSLKNKNIQYSDRYKKSYSNLPVKIKRKVDKLIKEISELETNQIRVGMNPEKIKSDMMSLRVDKNYRLLIKETDEDSYLIFDVGTHDIYRQYSR